MPVFFVLLMACASDSAQSAQPQHALPAQEPAQADQPTPGAEGETPAAEPVAEPEPAANACIQECVDSRQMQATSIEQIEKDCRAQCEGDDSETAP